MALSPEEEARESSDGPAFARDAAPSAGAPQGPRSGLSLGSTRPLPKTPTARPLPSQGKPSTAQLDEGLQRAKNIGVALGMIVLLLLQVLFQRVLWARVKHAFGLLKLRAIQLYHALGILLKPHLARLRNTSRQTSNQVVRATLLALIAIVSPLERSALQAAQAAKQEGAKLADGGARATLKVMGPLFASLIQLIRSGFNQAAVQRVVARLIQLTEEPPRR